MREKKKQLSSGNGLFRNEAGAIDLASIMVGVIVIGLLGGMTAATVFAVIPWAQDNGAKQQLDSVVAAQSAYMGLSSAVPPAVPTGHPANSYASTDQLDEAGLLDKGPKYCTTSTGSGKGFVVFSKSDSGKIWTASNNKTSPEVFTGTLPLECQYLKAGATADDLDGDGIPNAVDRDADGDGVQDGYVAGGPIATLTGTSSPTSGVYYSTLLTNGGSTLTSNVSNNGALQSRKIAMNFIVTCVKDDGSFYKKNLLNGYTAGTTSYNTNFNTTPCQTGERIDEYTVRPVTQEALASGEISNPEYFGGWTFTYNGAAGGVHWSEPDGYPVAGEFTSTQMANGNTGIYATFRYDGSSVVKQMVSQYTADCVRPDSTTYSVNKLTGFSSTYNTIANVTTLLTPCGTDRITAYNFGPLTKLGLVDNRSVFTGGYTIRGGKSWTEADSYPTSADFSSSLLAGGGSTLYMSFKYDGVAAVRSISAQYELTCQRPDTSTYKVNRIATFNSTYNTIATVTVTSNNCGSDQISAYNIGPVTNIGAAQNPQDFTGGWTIRGTKSWSEADGYPKSGNFQSSLLGNGGSTVYATYRNETGTVLTLSTQYSMNCERSDKTTYSVNGIASYTTRYNTIENTTLQLKGCGTDRITAYEIFPVNKLGDAQDRSSFGGYGINGTKSWNEAGDGYPTNGSFQSATLTGTIVYATFRNATGTSTSLATQYTMTCERADKTTYTVNKLAGFTSRAGYIENTTLQLNGCGSDTINAYNIFPVSKLGDVDNRSVFGGYGMTGTYSWTK